MDKIKNRTYCPFSCSLNIWGDKWSLLIIRDMMFAGKKTYGDFLKSPEGIATNILAARLTTLEQHGIIEKSGHPESKAKILYKLTPKGVGLLPARAEIYLWAEEYYHVPEEIRKRMDIFKERKEEMVRELKEKLVRENE